MSRRQGYWQTFKQDLPLSLAFSLPGSFFGMPADQRHLFPVAAITGALIFTSVLATAQTYVFPAVVRCRSFILSVVLTALSYAVVLLIAFPAMFLTMIGLTAKRPPWDPEVVAIFRQVFVQPVILPWLGMAFGAMVAITFLFMISRKLGPGVLMNWMLGRYYRPRQEERIFMFLDMRDSTTLAEQMGDMKFSALVREFLNDLSYPVLQTRGEVSHYIGDEAVLCWKVEHGLKDARCLKMFFLMQEELELRRAFYEKEFGFVPGFKAGAHVGSVVATQVGEIKSEIVFHGDVLNTSARIQGLCNSLGDDFLISRELRDRLQIGAKFKAVSRGEHELKGKALPVEVFAVTRPN